MKGSKKVGRSIGRLSKDKNQKDQRKRKFPTPGLLGAIGLIIGVALISYSNTFHVPFLFDDQANILNNPNIHIKVWSWDRFAILIKNTYKESIRILSYLSFAINYYFGNFNVLGYHLVNLGIHIFSGILLFVFLALTFKLPSLFQSIGPVSYSLSIFTTLIFISHPVQTQSVTYIVQRMTSMAGMFYLLTMVLYVKGRITNPNKRWIYFIMAGVTYLLGIFSKENVAILPLFIILYELFFLQNFNLRSKEKRIFLILIFVVTLIAIIGLLVWGKRYYELILEGYKIRDFTLKERILTQFRVVLYYITLLIYPHPSRLNLDYDFPISKSLLNPPSTLISIVVVGILISYSILIAKKRPLWSFCILWYFGNLVIESSIFPLEMVFEHRLYLPSIGPFILFSLFLLKVGKLLDQFFLKYYSRLSKKEGSRIKIVGEGNGVKNKIFEILLIIGVVLVLSNWTYSRNKVWNSDVTLWEDCVRKSPNKPRAHENLGVAYERVGEYYKAIKSIEKAIQINPRYANGYYNYGLILHKMGETEKGISMIKKALELDPGITIAYYSLGGIFFEKGRYEESEKALTRFLNIYPYYPEAHHNLALAYAAQKKFDEAVRELELELKINPYHALAHLNLGQIYWYEFKNKEKAVKHLKAALILDPFLPNRKGIQSLLNQIERIF